MYAINETIRVLRLPKASDITPLGISVTNIMISLIEYSNPICKKSIPFSRKKSIRNASKKRRFLKNP